MKNFLLSIARYIAGFAGALVAIVGCFILPTRATGLGLLMVLVGGAALFWAVYVRRRPSESYDGRRVRGGIYGDAHFCDVEEVKALGLIRPDGIPLGYINTAPPAGEINIARLRYAGDQHILTIAPSRTGKGTTAIIPALLEYPGSVLVVDPKGQNAAVTARRRRELGQDVVLLNPFRMHAAHFEAVGVTPAKSFNPLAALDADADGFVADVSSLCEAMILSSERDPHWGDSARDLVSALIMHLVATRKDKASLREVRKLLTQPIAGPKDGQPPPGTLMHTLLRISTGSCVPAAQRASRFVGEVTREFQSVLSTALTQTAFLDDPAIAASLTGDDFRFADLKTRPVSVYLILPSCYIAAYSRWLRLMTVAAIDALTTAPGRPAKPVLLLLDEFAQLGRMSSIENAMALAAGYGVQIWPIVQDIGQLKQLYSDRWETFAANTGVLQVFRPNDLTTAEYFSRRAGTRTVEVESKSEQEISREQAGHGFQGISFSYSKQAVPLKRPLEFFGLDQAQSILFVAGSEFPVFAFRAPYYSVDTYQGQYDADPYHLPPAPAPQQPVRAPAPPAPPRAPASAPAAAQPVPATPPPVAPVPVAAAPAPSTSEPESAQMDEGARVPETVVAEDEWQTFPWEDPEEAETEVPLDATSAVAPAAPVGESIKVEPQAGPIAPAAPAQAPAPIVSAPPVFTVVGQPAGVAMTAGSWAGLHDPTNAYVAAAGKKPPPPPAPEAG